MTANLSYYIFEGILTGIAGSQMFHLPALSGGAGGTTRSNTTFAVNNPYMEGLKTKGAPGDKNHVHGGPIPPGRYLIKTPAKHPHLGLSAQLIAAGLRPMGRDGFYIHGRGHHGSDGCIVPLSRDKFQDLMNALQSSKGGTLIVAETMDGTRFA